jgi:replicative DNA helicase
LGSEAGLLHIASHYSHNSQNWEIDGDTIDRALHLADYLLAHAQAAYAEIGADPAIDAAKMVLRWIEKTNARTFTKRDCYQGVKGTLKRADDLDPVLSLLVDHGYIREADVPERSGPGRKASAPYEVNPIVFDGSHNSHNSQNSSGARYEP